MVIALKNTVEWHNSQDPEAKNRPLFIFVHHFGGSSTTTKRHYTALMEMGYNSVSFTLSFNGTGSPLNWPYNLITRWAGEIDRVINLAPPNQKKILFCFSGPSASGLGALAKRYKRKNYDIVGFIADSGPFIDTWQCTRNLVRDFYNVKSPILREIRLFALMFAWGFNHNEKLLKSVNTIFEIKPDLPILSFRSIDDALVPLEKIDGVFKKFNFKYLKVAEFKSAHLAALRDYPDEYKEILKTFLEKIK